MSTPAPVTVYVPRDSAATSVGADEVAAALVRAADREKRPIRLIRNGSRGMLWLEPLVEVVTPNGRVGYGPVAPAQVDGLVAAGMFDAADHPSRVGRGRGPALAGDTESGHLRQGRCHGSVVAGGLPRVTAASPDCGGHCRCLRPTWSPRSRTPDCVGAVARASPQASSGRPSRDCVDELKFVCCNADEGDSGTFADRMVMEGDPFMLIEGMTIAAYAVGASEGYVYIRSEYPDAVATMRGAIDIARGRGWLGDDVLGSGTTLRPARQGGRRSLHLRRGDLHAGESRGQARHGPCEAADPGHPRAVRQADGGQQRADAGQRADHPRRRCAGVSGAWRRTVAWHPAVPARREHPARRHRGEGLRGDARRTRRRLRRRNRIRVARCARSRSVARSARICREPTSTCRWTTRHSPRPGPWSVTAASWCSTTPSTWRPRPGSPWSSAPRSRAASARRAGSARCAAWR